MSTRVLGQCLICDAKAVGINFAVPTCAACKAFFRRNAAKVDRHDFVCREANNCPVTYRSRRFCNYCRLVKCFQVGMQKTLIRSETERAARKQLVEQNRQQRVQHLDVIRPSALLLSSYSPLQHLSHQDQTLLTNLLGAYERTCLVTQMTQSPTFPVSKHSSLHTFLSEYSARQQSLVKYFKMIPEFEKLSIADKIRLIRNNFCITLPLNEGALSTNISQQLIDSVSIVFSASMSVQLIQCIKIIHSYNTDRTVLKLLLLISCFSSGINRYRNDVEADRTYDDTLGIFAAQNIYVELLWRYLLRCFPSDFHVIRYFNQLMRDLLFVQRIYMMADSVINNLANEVQQMEPLMQSMWPLSEPTNGVDRNNGEINIFSRSRKR